MSGYLIQSRKHVTVLAVEVARCSSIVNKAEAALLPADIATSIDDDAALDPCQSVWGEGSSHLATIPLPSFDPPEASKQARAGVEVAILEPYHNTQLSHLVN